MSEGKPLVEDENTTLDKIIKYFPRFALPIGILMLLAYFGNFNDGFGNQSDFGAFGDFFGGILNPMLTFFTILLLLRQLKYQRSELNSTAAELRATAEIHKETMKHNQAVDIYEKTYEKYNKAIQDFRSSLVNSFVVLSKDGKVLRGALTFEDKADLSSTVPITLDGLKVEKGVIQTILYSPEAEIFIDRLKLALNRSVFLGNEVYNFADEYQRLGVNNLLYLKEFELFKGTLEELHDDVNSLDVETDTLQINSVLNALIHQSISTIAKAQHIPNLD